MKHMMNQFFTIISIFLLLSPQLGADTVKENESSFKFEDILHYQTPVKKGDTEKKWSLNMSAGYTKSSGNTDLTNNTYGFLLKYNDYITVLKLNYYGSYGKLKETVIENKGTATLNFDYFLFWRIEFFSYTMSDYNKITLLTHRNGTGAGAKIFIIRNSYLLVDLSGAPIYQYEKYEDQSPDENWKWSIRGRAEIFPFDDNFSIKYYIFYIPSMKDKSNYRTRQELTLYHKLIGPVSLKAGYRRDFNTYDKKSYEENPALQKTDSTTYVQISLAL